MDNNMNLKFPKRFFESVLVILAFTSFSVFAGASTAFKYTYTGNQFDDPPGVYSPQGYVSIEFIINELLVPRNGRFVLPITNVNDLSLPLSFKMGAGSTIIDSSFTNPDFIPTSRYGKSFGISFDTDIEGNIKGSWHVIASVQRASPCCGSSRDFIESVFNVPPFLSADSISSSLSWNGPGSPSSSKFSVNNSPGLWVRNPTTLVPTPNVPIPGAMLLFGCAFVGIFLSKRFSGLRT
jgi:hypothetical protein